MADSKLPDEISGWRGQTILGARSRGGTFAARDWRDLVLDPAGAIETKAAEIAGSAARWFAPAALASLTAVDGHYSYVQSINSEDTVTWAAFGPRASSRAIGEIVNLAFGLQPRPAEWERLYWQRWPHPHTRRTTSGPEPDVTLRADDGWGYVVEAKWAAKLDASQGKGGGLTQLEMRTHVARTLTADARKRGVLVIVPSPARYPYARRGTFAEYFAVEEDHYVPRDLARAQEARALTWEQIVDVLARIDGRSELTDYLAWRIAWLPSRTTSARRR